MGRRQREGQKKKSRAAQGQQGFGQPSGELWTPAPQGGPAVS